MKCSRHKTLILSISILLLMSFLYVGWYAFSLLKAPIIPKNSPAQIITLDRSATASQLINTLKDKKLISHPKMLRLLIRFSGLAHRLKAGTYQIIPGESARDLLYRIAAGDVLIQYVTIIEGTTQKKITQQLIHAPYLEYHNEDWLLIKGNHPNAEGMLLADTYQYRGGSSSTMLLTQANRNLLSYLNESWEHRATGLPYHTPYEMLIAASIVEKETAIPQERKLISGVMVNRLKKNMPLQMDPTVIYALGDLYTGKLVHNDLQVNSPYNSYRYRGLPPTPIAMVGKEAIDAIAHPQLSKFLYFVAKGDGSHQFSETYEQQKQAIEQFRHKDS